MPASLAYHGSSATDTGTGTGTNPAPFLLAPILNLPPSFGSAYVGETFSCTLCANHDIPPPPPPPPPAAEPPLSPLSAAAARLSLTAGPPPSSTAAQQQQQQKKKFIRDVRIEAEMKTPGSGGTVQKLVLGPLPPPPPGRPSPEAGHDGGEGEGEGEAADGDDKKEEATAAAADPGKSWKEAAAEGKGGTDLEPGQTLQRIVSFDLKEEGNHVLAVTVSYYEATETSGRARTFRKLYQFISKGSLIVRTKVSPVPAAAAASPLSFLPPLLSVSPPVEAPAADGRGDGGKGKEEKTSRRGGGGGGGGGGGSRPGRCWAMEAQLENCSEDVMQLERVGLDLEPGLRYADCNGWGVGGVEKPVLHPGEVEQCCFVIEEVGVGVGVDDDDDGRIVFGVLGIGWRSEMGNKGFLTTGKLGTRAAAAAAAAAPAR